MDKQVAERSILLAARLSALIEQLLIDSEGRCTETEFKTMKEGAALVMGYLHTEFMRPAYTQYPDSALVDLGGKVDPPVLDIEALYEQLVRIT